MGNTYITIKAILEELDIDVVCPPKCSKKTMELGTKYSPEFVCMPFKLNIGNYIEGIEKGADTIFMLTGCGPCRFGIFSSLQKEIMLDLGYKIDFITSDRFSNIEGLKEFYNLLNKASGKKGVFKILNTLKKGLKLLDEVDELNDLMNKVRPREIKKGEVDHLAIEFENEIITVQGFKASFALIDEYNQKLKSIEIDKDKDVIKIGIVGEIYTLIENYLNLNVEKKLGNMGVESHRSTTTSKFVRDTLDFIPLIRSDKKQVYKAASPYLATPVGGHGIHTIGNTLLYKEQGYDGIIHILPFTCMPEIVARSILPTIEREKDIPILTLVIDEMTGEGGYETRIEAFVDLLNKRREVKDYGKAISWN
ncbi:MAG: CoA protein activase [Haloplasmataceae bacterium]|jgi:predicted nucleotide-binding protein (sugar kinase/HSP70/actin superfamily)|nr:CoA protein activase [Haloplasmataceae bacterium]